MKRIAAALVSLLALVAMAAPSSANTGPNRWTIYSSRAFNPTVTGPVIQLYPEDHSFDGSLQPAINQEAYYWNQTGAAIHWNQAAWINDSSCHLSVGDSGHTGSGRISFCYLDQYPGNPEAGVANVQTVDGAITQCAVTLATSGYNNLQYDFIVGHEMGHCMGLTHTPNDATSLMYPYVGGSAGYQPNAQDAADLRAMYP